MNILYIAYSCDPFAGSEDKIGWNIPVTAAAHNHVHVITKEEHRETIERYIREHDVGDIHFHFVDIPGIYKKLFKGFLYSGRLNRWHKRAVKTAKRIVAATPIDIIHQITPIEFRSIGGYGRIEGPKFVVGPLGGGEQVPPGLKVYTRGHRITERIRGGMNAWSRFTLKRFGKLKSCDYVMCANRETAAYLGLADTCTVMTEIGMNPEDFAVRERADNARPVILAAGRMIYRKGYDFLFDALEALPADLNYECRMVGGGPEYERLKARRDASPKLTAHVVFTGLIPYTDMVNEYLRADAFVMPSIRETTGTVLLEAMSKSLPVITIDRFGGRELLDDETGYVYDADERDGYIAALCEALIACITDPAESKRRGEKARERAAHYTQEEKTAYYLSVYNSLLPHKDEKIGDAYEQDQENQPAVP